MYVVYRLTARGSSSYRPYPDIRDKFRDYMKEYSPIERPFYGYLTSVVVRPPLACAVHRPLTLVFISQNKKATAVTIRSSKCASSANAVVRYRSDADNTCSSGWCLSGQSPGRVVRMTGACTTA